MVLMMGVVFSSCGKDDDEEEPDTIVKIMPEERIDGVVGPYHGNDIIWMFDADVEFKDNVVNPEKCLIGAASNEKGEYVFNLKSYDVFDEASYASVIFYMLDDDRNVIGFTVCGLKKGETKTKTMIVERNKM